MNFTSPPKQPLPPLESGPQMGNLARRLKLLEELMENIRKRQQLLDQSILEHQKKTGVSIGSFEEELSSMRTDISDVKKNVRIIIEELQGCAKKEEVDTLQKYINLWEPIRFITINQAQKLIRDIVQDELERRQKP
ncbi:MAG: hypothetical protein ACMXYC_02655 [Candidatus Woesearchaeota archaeon]